MSDNVTNKTEAVSETGEKKKLTPKVIVDETLDLFRSLAVTFTIVLLVCTFVIRPANVFGISMNSTLYEGDFLVLWKLLYTPKQGDIVSANCPGLNEAIVKRVIALPGQEVDIDFGRGIVYVDGVALDEPYINNPTINDEGGFTYPVTVPEGCYFCMGDNRQHSKDSRSADVGFIPRDDILGKVIMRLYPFDSFKLF